jgi:hypothetical protein
MGAEPPNVDVTQENVDSIKVNGACRQAWPGARSLPFSGFPASEIGLRVVACTFLLRA